MTPPASGAVRGPRLLCVDTATWCESIALVEGDALLAERSILRRRGHGPGLLEDIDGLLRDAALTLADLDGYVCGTGPGGFTGLRVAMATLKGLALIDGLPIYGVPTTHALLAPAVGASALAVIDARRDEIYAAGPALAAPVCCRPADLPRHLRGRPTLLLGDGALRHRDALTAALPGVHIPASAALHAPRAALLAIGLDPAAPADLVTLEPIYVRPSDAELHYPDGFPVATDLAPRGQRART